MKFRNIYGTITSLDKNKSPGPDYINAWAIKIGKKELKNT